MAAWLERTAVAAGVVAIVLPLIGSWRARHLPRVRDPVPRPFLTRWPGVLVLAIAYVCLGAFLWKPLPLRLTAGVRLLLVLTGSLLYFPGILLYAWGWKALGPMFGVSSRASAYLYEGHRLIQGGPYSVVRHPMYLGVLLAAAGALLIFQTWAMAVYAPLASIVVARARREDEQLAEEFGAVWQRYRDRIPGWLPPIGRRHNGEG